MLVGNALALARPPATRDEGEYERAPLGRTLTMMGIGLIAALWGAITLIATA